MLMEQTIRLFVDHRRLGFSRHLNSTQLVRFEKWDVNTANNVGNPELHYKKSKMSNLYKLDPAAKSVRSPVVYGFFKGSTYHSFVLIWWWHWSPQGNGKLGRSERVSLVMRDEWVQRVKVDLEFEKKDEFFKLNKNNLWKYNNRGLKSSLVVSELDSRLWVRISSYTKY